MVTDLGKTRAKVARDLDINETTLGKWVAKATGTEGTGRGSHMRAPEPDSGDPRELARENARLRLENEFLKSCGLLRKGTVTLVRKYELMLREEGSSTVELMAQILELHRSGYSAWKHAQTKESLPRPRQRRRAWLMPMIRKIRDYSKRVYGALKVRAKLAETGEQVSLWLVAKLMRELGIAGVHPRASKRTTIPGEDAKTRRDFVWRRFAPPVPTTCLVGDITYLKTGGVACLL